MATVVSITNPITGAVEQVDKLDHTAQQIDDAVALAPQLSNPNLLDNWYFANPVNQRGQTSYTGAGYGIDRWKSSNSNLAVNLAGDGIVLSSGSAAGYLAQYFDGGIPIEDSYTISTLVEAITVTAYFQAVYSDGTYGKAMKLAAGLNVLTVKAAKTISRVLFQVNSGSSVTVNSAKLELGSQQTLAHQDANGNWVLNEIPDYGEQLRRCQRYFYRFNFDRNDIFFGSLSTNLDKAWITIPTPVVMRTAPSVSFSTAFNVVIRGNGFQLQALASNSTVAADTSTTRCCNILITPNTKPSAWTAQQVVMIYTSTEWYMDCSADL